MNVFHFNLRVSCSFYSTFCATETFLAANHIMFLFLEVIKNYRSNFGIKLSGLLVTLFLLVGWQFTLSSSRPLSRLKFILTKASKILLDELSHSLSHSPSLTLSLSKMHLL